MLSDIYRTRNLRAEDYLWYMPIPTSVYAEMTPNPAVMKFVADRPLIEGEYQAEFRSKTEASWCSPLGRRVVQLSLREGRFHQRMLRICEQRRVLGLGNDCAAIAGIRAGMADGE